MSNLIKYTLKVVRAFKHKIHIFYVKSIIKKNKHRVKNFKDVHKNQRCFIIGNGPSLTKKDLEMLDKDITFASNGIYFMFDKTEWRPTYYTVQDHSMITNRSDMIISLLDELVCFVAVVIDWKYPRKLLNNKNSIILELVLKEFDENNITRFSDDLVNGVYEGWTVTYFNIQLAVYMGFKEIYLLGVDNNYSMGGSGHFSKDDVCDNVPRLDKTEIAYRSAKKYVDEHGIKIYNATRGGKLETFERVDFDSLFGKEVVK